MRSLLSVSFGEVADWERRHSSEGVTGHLVALGKEASGVRGAQVLGRRFSWAFLGRLSFGPGPGVLGPAEFWAWSLGWACHTPIPGPTRLADPNRVRGARPYTGTLYLIFFFF